MKDVTYKGWHVTMIGPERFEYRYYPTPTNLRTHYSLFIKPDQKILYKCTIQHPKSILDYIDTSLYFEDVKNPTLEEIIMLGLEFNITDEVIELMKLISNYKEEERCLKNMI